MRDQPPQEAETIFSEPVDRLKEADALLHVRGGHGSIQLRASEPTIAMVASSMRWPVRVFCIRRSIGQQGKQCNSRMRRLPRTTYDAVILGGTPLVIGTYRGMTANEDLPTASTHHTS